MPSVYRWWAKHFERVSGSKYKCLLCQEVKDSRGRGAERHLASIHQLSGNVVPPPPTPDEDEAPSDSVDRLEGALDGLSRDERLTNLLGIARDSTAAPRDRVAAEGLIAKYQGWLDRPPEEDESEARDKMVARYKRAIEKKSSLNEEVDRVVRDMEVRFYLLRRLIQYEEDRQWALKAMESLGKLPNRTNALQTAQRLGRA